MVVTDVQMPEIDGLALADKLSKLQPELPVVFMSGGADERLRARGLRPNIDVVTKPLSPEKLDARIREAVASSSSLARAAP